MWFLTLAGLYLSSLYNYLLFHSLAEFFSIAVACGIFMIAWNSRRFMENNYLLVMGIAYLFIGGLDMIHTLAYKGMGIFPEYGANLPTQLWIAARYTESISLLIAPLFLSRKLPHKLVLAGYAVATTLLLLSIFYWKVFPDCFLEGSGLTPFKKISEYVICSVFMGTLVLLYRVRSDFDRSVFLLLAASIILSMLADLAFTFYVEVYGLSNLVGHYLKLISYYLIYKALIETGLVKPYDLLFRNLKKSEEALRESEERFRAIAEYTYDVESWISVDGRLLWANPAVQRLTGYSVEECMAMPHYPLPLIHEEDRRHTAKLFLKAVRRRTTRTDQAFRIRRKDGTSLWVAASWQPIYDSSGEYIGIRGSVHDISVQRSMEAQRESLLMELKAKNDELEQYAYTVSHDLKGPLITINGFLGMIEEDIAAGNTGRIKESMAEIVFAVKKMGQLLGKILELSRSGRAIDSPEPIDFEDLARETMRLLAGPVANTGAQVSITGGGVIIGDRLRLRQVLQNLLDNALKFMNGRPDPRVEIGSRQDGGETVFYVRDNGTGVDPDNHDKIFGLFRKLDRNTDGTGAGLTIVQRIVGVHGGRVWLESEGVGKGSTFCFTAAPAEKLENGPAVTPAH